MKKCCPCCPCCRRLRKCYFALVCTQESPLSYTSTEFLESHTPTVGISINDSLHTSTSYTLHRKYVVFLQLLTSLETRKKISQDVNCQYFLAIFWFKTTSSLNCILQKAAHNYHCRNYIYWQFLVISPFDVASRLCVFYLCRQQIAPAKQVGTFCQ